MMATRSPGFSTSTRSSQPFEAVLGVQADPRAEGGCDPRLVALDRGAHVLLGDVNEIRSGGTLDADVGPIAMSTQVKAREPAVPGSSV